MRYFAAWLLATCLGGAALAATDTNLGFIQLQKRAFFLGREYFVLRSGRAQMILQADRADVGPAFTYMLFDAQDARQSARKDWAFNFTQDEGVAQSALVVELGGFPFTALGHRTETRWVLADGIPAVEAVWWAGGVRVTEHFCALGDQGLFQRQVRLEGAHLLGEESVQLRLRLPSGLVRLTSRPPAPAGQAGAAAAPGGIRVALGVLGDTPTRVIDNGAGLEIGPVTVAPGQSTVVPTLLFTQLPVGDAEAFADYARTVQATLAQAELEATRAGWARAARVTTQDHTIHELFDKARFGLPGMIAEDGAMDAGIFEYGAQWVRDTANTALGALHAGHFEITRRALVRILTQMVSREGATMIAGSFDTPDREQFDQMGELLHLLKAYRDWTGQDDLIRQHRELLLAMIERPLEPRFRDETGMVHNRREFWERTFDDAYELAYQTYVILGLRDAAALAPSLGAPDRAGRWRAEADRIQKALLEHPGRALVQEGRLIKRRNLTGEVADRLTNFKGFAPDVPLNTETHHRLRPDASQALPIALGVVDAQSDLARRTLEDLEALWNTRWSDGGYDRYHTSTQPDQPGPWPFATTFILRAQHEARLFDRSRRSLEWLNTVQGGRAGAWFEEIPSIRSLNRTCGIVCWTSGEIALFVVRHYLGVRFEGDRLVIRPALYPASPPVVADLRFRGGRLRLEIDGAGPIREGRVNGMKLKPAADGSLRLPRDFAEGSVVIRTRGK